jgi:hypothetical protein
MDRFREEVCSVKVVIIGVHLLFGVFVDVEIAIIEVVNLWDMCIWFRDVREVLWIGKKRKNARIEKKKKMSVMEESCCGVRWWVKEEV